MPISGRIFSARKTPSGILAVLYLPRPPGSAGSLPLPRRPFPDASLPGFQMLPCHPVGPAAPARGRPQAAPSRPGPYPSLPVPVPPLPLILGRLPSLFGYAILIPLSSTPPPALFFLTPLRILLLQLITNCRILNP